MPHRLHPGVLIVEDEEALLSLVAGLLAEEAYVIYRARDGAEALAVFAENTSDIDVVMTDLGLPQVGGADVIASIRQRKPSVKIVGISGYGAQEARSVALAAGADIFCEKPFDIGGVLASIRKLLSTP
ncbi:MAG TPA: response regulator [Bacteroidota bacterium]|nr:response regulator [Bacteroidota bacterium]